MARRYCEAVVDRKVPACRYVRLACRRYLDMLKAAAGKRSKVYFSIEDAVDVCDFAEKMPHLEGTWDDDCIVLQPCQCFWLIAIFGFRWKRTGHRVVSHVYMEVPRKSGKSILIAIIALYCFLCEGEHGSQVYIGAPKDDQAEKVYGPMKALVDQTPSLQAQFNLTTTLKRISKKDDTLAFITKISSVAEREDGHNPHLVVMEELHAQKPELYKVMDSATGARAQLLFLSIGTAGRLAAGIGWEERKKLIKVLEGQEKLIHWFGVIYTLDEEDYEDDESVFLSKEMIMKANPMYDVSVLPQRVIEFGQNCKGDGPKMLEFKRTRFNIWTGAAGDLISAADWAACEDTSLTLEDFEGEQAFIGGDLATKNDFAALAILFERDKILYTFHEYFLPEFCPTLSDEAVGALYLSWMDSGVVTVTNGGTIDYNVIEDRIRYWCRLFDVQGINFDTYQSNQILSNLYNDGLPAGEMQPGIKHVSDPTKDLLARIIACELRHPGHPITTWMATNVKGYYDQRENVLPKKESPNSKFRIDGFAATVMANALRTDADYKPKKKWKSVYSSRGIVGADVEAKAEKDARAR